jgi:hypothetical protein
MNLTMNPIDHSLILDCNFKKTLNTITFQNKKKTLNLIISLNPDQFTSKIRLNLRLK